MNNFPTDSKQALRYRRALMGLGAYSMWMALGMVMLSAGLLRVGLTGIMVICLGILAVSLATLLTIRSGVNLRFRDPSLTVPQMTAGILLAGAFVAVVEPGSRGVTLLLFVSILFFGIFRLSKRQFVPLALLAIVLYGAIIAWEAPELSSTQFSEELTHLVVFGAVLVWLSVMGSHVAQLRADLREAVNKIDEMAHTDELTGSENRRSITDELRQAMTDGMGPTEALAVCLLDLDHFKRVNDAHGHSVGDEVLQEFVQRASRTLRSHDRVGQDTGSGHFGRFGGEEFLVVLRGAGNSGARRAAERIRAAVSAQPFQTSAGPVRITASAGVAAWDPPETETDLIRRADAALYEAKEKGRNCVRASVNGRHSSGNRENVRHRRVNPEVGSDFR